MCTEPVTAGLRGSLNGHLACRNRFHRRFAAEPTEVRDALRGAVARFARRIPAEASGTLELALAEALNNVVEHGYAGLTAGTIELQLTCNQSALSCEIADNGHPMPGLVPPEGQMPPLPENPAELPEGGWGWSLIRALTSSLAYRREGGRNHLSFKIPLSSN